MRDCIVRFFKFLLMFLGAISAVFLAITSWFAFSSGPSVSVPQKAYLSMVIHGDIVEYHANDGLTRLFEPQKHSLHHMIQVLKAAKNDPRIQAVVLHTGDHNMGLAKIDALRLALKDFKLKGKKVFVFADTFGETENAIKNYYLASAADEIWMQPLGQLHLKGFAVTVPFVRKLLGYIGVRPDFHRRHEYKGAPETFMHEKSSLEYEKEWTVLIHDMLERVTRDIAGDRKLDEAFLKQVLSQGQLMDEEALNKKLIDRIGGLGDLVQSLKQAFGKDIHGLSYMDYGDQLHADDDHRDADHLALCYMSGEITRDLGDSESEYTVSNILSFQTDQILRKLAHDPHVKAIVLRVDSPGGSVVASETVSQAIQYCKKKGKKIVVSMSDVAASGGYWIAADADLIVAHPTTITGSIGVYAGKFDIENLSKMIGVSWEHFFTHESALDSSFTSPFSPEALARLNQSLDMVYKKFVQKVSKARNLSAEEVDKVARGRILLGEKAFSSRLVDQLGDLNLAIRETYKLGGMSQPLPVVVYPKNKTLSDLICEIIWGPQGFDVSLKSLIKLLISHIKMGIKSYIIHSIQNTLKNDELEARLENEEMMSLSVN